MGRARRLIVISVLLGCADGAVEDRLRPPPPDGAVEVADGLPPRDARPTFDGPSADDGSAFDLGDGAPSDARPSDRPDDGVSFDVGAVTDGAPPDGPLPDGPLPDGPLLDAALPDGPLLDGPLPDAAPADAAPDVPLPDATPCLDETCNGLDDDCDGQVDEGPTCGPYVSARCVLYAGWSDRNLHPLGVAPAWGACPPADRGLVERDRHCVGTRRDGRFARLPLGGDVDGDDALGVALRCDDPDDPALAAYIQSHCALFMGWADSDRGVDGLAAWGACPNSVASNVGALRCTSTGYDGNFRALDLDGNVDENDDLGFAWLCDDPADSARAAALSAAVAVYVGWADNNRAPPDTSEVWGPCPAQPSGEVVNQRCISTFGDRRFHRLDLDGDVDDNDHLGFSLRAR